MQGSQGNRLHSITLGKLELIRSFGDSFGGIELSEAGGRVCGPARSSHSAEVSLAVLPMTYMPLATAAVVNGILMRAAAPSTVPCGRACPLPPSLLPHTVIVHER